MSSRLVRRESRSIKRGQSVGGAFSIGVCELPIPRTIRAITLLRFAVSPTVAQLAPGGDHFWKSITARAEPFQRLAVRAGPGDRDPIERHQKTPAIWRWRCHRRHLRE